MVDLEQRVTPWLWPPFLPPIKIWWGPPSGAVPVLRAVPAQLGHCSEGRHRARAAASGWSPAWHTGCMKRDETRPAAL